MSVADPEMLVKYMNKLDTTFSHFNTVVSGLTRVIDKNIRAQTKVIAVANKQRGIMMGVVADLELMGGAFGKIKRALANLFLPIDKDTPKIFKYTQGLLSLSGAYTNLWKPFRQHLKSKKEEAIVQKILNKKAQETLRSRLMGGTLSIKNIKKSLLTGISTKEMEMTPLGGTKLADALGLAPTQTRPPKEFTRFGLGPVEKPKEGIGKRIGGIGKTLKGFTEMGSSKMKAGMKMWKTNVTGPIKQIAAGGIGLGFQIMLVMALMQAFASLFAIFQPVMDVIGALMERLSVGFIPIVTMMIDIITSPPVLEMIDALSAAMFAFFEIFKPLTPIIISMIGIALMPLMIILGALTPTFKMLGMIFGVIFTAIAPLFKLLSGSLAPIIEFLTKVFGILLVAGLYPLVGAMYAIGMVVAGIIDLASGFTAGAMKDWENTMMPIFNAMGAATAGIIGSFQMGTDFVPQTGIYHLTRGEGVKTVEENLYGRDASPIIINMYGSYLGADMEDLSNRIAKKLSLYRF